MVILKEVTRIHAPIERCFDLARSVEVHILGNVHYGESAIAADGLTCGLIERGQAVTWRARHFGIRFHLTSTITEFDRPAHFQDIQVRGPFHSVRHDHYFRSISDAVTEMEDVFEFEAPVPLVGRLVEIAILRNYMGKLLRERMDVIRQVAESDDWRQYLPCES